MLFYNRISRVPKGFAASAFFLQLKSVHRSGYTGRLTNDAVKTMEGETSIMEGGRTEEAGASSPGRLRRHGNRSGR